MFLSFCSEAKNPVKKYDQEFCPQLRIWVVLPTVNRWVDGKRTKNLPNDLARREQKYLIFFG
jgi:hypothetical protein